MEKVKRKRVKWFEVYKILATPSMDEYFTYLLGKHKPNKRHHLSMNRCAYYTLKKFYSTTAIVQLRERFGSL